MDVKKEMVVLSGGGHKGMVKFAPMPNKLGWVKGSCNLDFRPKGAVLYLVGDKIAKVAVDDVNTAFEVPFCASGEYGCVLRSSAVTMLGGRMSKSCMLSAVDNYVKNERVKKASALSKGETAQKTEIAPKEQLPQVDTFCNDKPFASLENLATDGSAFDFVKYDGNNFYLAIKPQLDEMFVCYKSEDVLNNAVENSKWVRVDATDGAYVVGVLFDENVPSFICYGVPSKRGINPPSEIADMCVWLPLDGDDGYWVIYQSAKTGNIVK